MHKGLFALLEIALKAVPLSAGNTHSMILNMTTNDGIFSLESVIDFQFLYM
jgi:hypothetical protein